MKHEIIHLDDVTLTSREILEQRNESAISIQREKAHKTEI